MSCTSNNRVSREIHPRPARAPAVVASLAMLLLTLSCSPPSPPPEVPPAADAVADGSAPTPVSVPDTQVRVLQAGNGRSHRAYVWAPSGPAPASGRPVIYVLDGETTFMLVRDIARSLASAYPQIDLPVVVALGYDTPEPYSPDGLATVLRERSYDYTPAVPEELLGESFNAQPWPPTGGADEFLDFIELQLKPAIEADFPIDRDRQVLMGHSFGGLFTLHAFFTRPESFSTYVASSPSNWYGDRYLDRAQQAFSESRSERLDGKRVLITVGSLEQSRVPERGEHGDARWLANSRMVDGMRELVARMEGLRGLGLELESRVYEGESHLSAKPPAANYGMRFALLPPARAAGPAEIAANASTADGEFPAYRMPGSVTWLESTGLGEVRVSAVLPVFPRSVETPEAGYPLVVFLDAQDGYGVFADTMRRLEGGRMLSPAILVGIETADGRALSPESLTELVDSRIEPRLARDYRLDPQRRLLVGHGDAAIAVLQTLSTQPQAFGSWAVLNPPAPAVDALRQAGPVQPAAGQAGGRVLLLAGDADGDDFPGALQGGDDPQVPAALHGLGEWLQPLQAQGWQVESRVLEREDNLFSTAAIAEALLFELDTADRSP